MEFLRKIEHREFPEDYLLARIRGRRTFLLNDWEKALASPDIMEYLKSTHYGNFVSGHFEEGIWELYLREAEWVYNQMNNKLRNIFKPWFMHSELNTLLLCLRYKSDRGNDAVLGGLLQNSLLSVTVKNILKANEDIPSVLSALDRKPALITDGLENVFLKNGLQGIEQELTNSLLEHIMGRDMHQVMGRFFAHTIDSRNITVINRCLRWEIASEPVLIDGGDIRTSMLRRILRLRDTDALVQLVQKRTGIQLEKASSAGIENSFRTGMAGLIKKWERESPDIGLILGYLWRCATEAENLSILYHGSTIDKQTVREELA